MKCMVIDGNSIINRAYYGIRPLTNREGLYTHAVFGFLTTLLRLNGGRTAGCPVRHLRPPRPYLPPQGGRGVQGHRKPMPEELRMQVPVLKRCSDTLNIPDMKSWEADDLIGTISRKCEAAAGTA